MRYEIRPWGFFAIVHRERKLGWQIKKVVVNPESRISLQRHSHRSEYWIIMEGEARITKGELVYEAKVGHSVDIPVGEIHRLENIGDGLLVVVEVQTGERIEDSYGRTDYI